MCVCAGVLAHVSMYGKPEIDVNMFFSTISLTYFLRQALSLSLELCFGFTAWPAWLQDGPISISVELDKYTLPYSVFMYIRGI